MNPIRVKPYPVARSFSSFEAAIRHACSHPRLADARRDAERLKGSIFIDACWTLYEWVIRFDSDLTLRAWMERAEILWSLEPSSVVSARDDFQRVGAPPVVLDWGGHIGLCEMDCSSLVAKRRGARFKDLFYNEHGLFIYLHEHLILQLHPAQRIEDGRSIIYVIEDD